MSSSRPATSRHDLAPGPVDECTLLVWFPQRRESRRGLFPTIAVRAQPLRSISVNNHGSHRCVFALLQKRAGTTAAAYAAYCTRAASRNPQLAGTHSTRVKPQHNQRSLHSIERAETTGEQRTGKGVPRRCISRLVFCNSSSPPSFTCHARFGESMVYLPAASHACPLTPALLNIVSIL